MNDWFASLAGVFDYAWGVLEDGVRDPSQAARFPTMATVSPDGWPEARTLVLRDAHRHDGRLLFYTDLQSYKTDSLAANPRGSVHVWDNPRNLQLRLQCEIAVLRGANVDAHWAMVPPPRRVGYGAEPPPGRPITTALAYERHARRNDFGVLSCAVHNIDVVHLGEDHRRAAFSREDDWAGEWLSP